MNKWDKQFNNHLFIWLVVFLAPLTAQTQADIAEPQGYKMENYRSPTPATLVGATVINANQAKQFLENDNAVFIDVLPSPKRPVELSENDVWLPKERFNIPGSVWLADIGFGVLSDELENYFKSNLKRLQNDKNQKLVFYCNANCWMSWNAAKRALNYGFKPVYWFPGGVDEWAEMGYELEHSNPKEING